MPHLRYWSRALRLAFHLSVGLAIAVLLLVDRWRILPAERLASWWWGKVVEIFRLRLAVRGVRGEGPRLLVANHVSWLDVAAIGRLEAVSFVAKSEVRRWPLIGLLARGGGTLFIKRGHGATKTVDAITDRLRQGRSVLVFPEGTTSRGDTVRRFHSRLFQAAIDAGVPVQPIALRYTGRAATAAPFVDDDALVPHIFRLLKEPELALEVIFGESLDPSGQSRDQVAKSARREIAQGIGVQLPFGNAAREVCGKMPLSSRNDSHASASRSSGSRLD